MDNKGVNKQISYYLDLEKEEGMVIFGYFFNDYFEMIDEQEALTERVVGFCERNNKIIDYNILLTDYSQYELQIKVITRDEI